MPLSEIRRAAVRPSEMVASAPPCGVLGRLNAGCLSAWCSSVRNGRFGAAVRRFGTVGRAAARARDALVWSALHPSADAGRKDCPVGYIDVAGVSLMLPDGRPLLDEVSFRVGEGRTTALIGANGAGKTTLLRMIRDEVAPDSGVISVGGGLGVMDQFVGHSRSPGET